MSLFAAKLSPIQRLSARVEMLEYEVDRMQGREDAPALPDRSAIDAAGLVAKYGSVANAALKSGIQRTTLRDLLRRQGVESPGMSTGAKVATVGGIVTGLLGLVWLARRPSAPAPEGT